MKKIALLLIFGFFYMGVSNAQNIEVPVSQNPMIVKIAASWCPPCGSWGWTFFDQIYADNSSEAIMLSVHHSGNHTNTAAQEITQNFSVFGQPRFIFDGEDQNVTSSNGSSKRTSIENMVDDVTGQNPQIQTGLEATYSGDNLLVAYSVELFENLSGEYNVAFYLVEKVHTGYQASIGDNAQHKTLLRKELSGSTFGSELFNGTGFSGDIHDGYFQLPLESYDPQNLQVVSVIWKKNGNIWEVVNSNVDKSVVQQSTSSSSDLSLEKADFNVYPTKVSSSLNIEIALSESILDANIDLVDVFGRKVANIYKGRLDEGNNELKWMNDRSMEAGIYFVLLQSEKLSIPKKIIIE